VKKKLKTANGLGRIFIEGRIRVSNIWKFGEERLKRIKGFEREQNFLSDTITTSSNINFKFKLNVL